MRGRVLAVWICVAAGSALLAVAVARLALVLHPDAIGYVAVARNWILGRGFVDPILYSYYVDAKPPLAAIVIRPPLVSVLFALPLALGSDLAGLHILHALWGSAIGASSLWIARRMLPLAAAAACAVAIAWSPAWISASTMLMTEVTAVGVLLLLLAAAPSALGCVRWALGLAVLTLIGWLTRPNLGAFAPMFALAACLHLGPRQALRSTPLWVYLGSFALLNLAVSQGVRALLGFSPYQHYGIMVETLQHDDVALYQVHYAGALHFALGHLPELGVILLQNVAKAGDFVFVRPFYMYVGWIAVPGVAYGLLHRGPDGFLRRLVAVAALGFAGIALLSSWGFSATRYLLPAAVCGWFAAILFLHDAARSAWQRFGRGPSPALVASLFPLVIVLGLALAVSGAAARKAVASFSRRPAATPVLQAGDHWNAPSRALCAHLDRDALVASPEPWPFLYWCGNAGYTIPPDLGDLAALDRYLDDKTPGYLVVDRGDVARLFETSPRLERAYAVGDVTLFRVIDAPPESRPWRSPGPLEEIRRRP